jgi:type IV pilus assembly protein PilM
VTKVLAEKLGLPFASAEQFKFDLSVSLSAEAKEELPQLLVKTLEPIVTEIQYMLDFFRSQNSGSVEKVILSGGGALLLNLADYLTERLNVQTIIGDPWNRVRYPEELKPVLQEVGPRLAVAIGLAMREID